MRKSNNIKPLFFLSLICNLLIFISAQPPSSYYDPNDQITLGCGSTSDSPAPDGRTWAADTNRKFLLGDENKVSVALSVLNPPKDITDYSPYKYARLSRSQFTYSFPVTSGPKFVRLYFYPTTYPEGFNKSDAFFDVTANSFTLVSNFSAALHAEYLQEGAFFKEYSFVVKDGERVNLTFRPSSSMPFAYAFINAIEILSMPSYLYYTQEDDPTKELINVDQSGRRSVDNETAMELMYRINVGGSTISPDKDTGMYRTWENDAIYLAIAIMSTLPVNATVDLNFKIIKNYTAPADVYRTARSMGNNKTSNDHYKLTWTFKVDPSFPYFIRLHFCEFQQEIQEQGDRVFQIDIGDYVADGHADVIYWSGGNGIPIFRDYAVVMGRKGNEKEQNLSVALHTVSSRQTSYSDAILNGLELFKLSNSYNLSGPNPAGTGTNSDTTPAQKSSTKSKKNGRTIATIVGSAVSGIVALSILFFFIFRRKLRVKDWASADGASRWSLHSFSTTKSSKTHGSSLPSDLCRRFSLGEIKAATNNFDAVFIIGVGGFGNVYKGFINDGAKSVAIKRLNPESQQGVNEFKTEIEMLSQLRHVHLVSLIGYCNEGQEMALVYDYMAHGTLREHLYKTDNPPLSWNQRLEICIGAARGLLYLHSGAKHTIIHRDVKTTNILLDEKWVAKVSDFGLSKIGPTNMANAHVSTVVKGSFGYLDPEYYRLQRLTEKSDVYSFGVVLCEVLCARPPISRLVTNQPVSLAEWVRQSYKKGTTIEVVDPNLQGKIAVECLNKYVEIAVKCMLDNGVDRPSMSDVVWGLEFALQLQESAEKELAGEIEGQTEFRPIDSPLLGSTTGDDSENYSFSNSSGIMMDSRLTGISITSSSTGERSVTTSNDSSDQKLMSGAVFSEIMNPTGR